MLRYHGSSHNFFLLQSLSDAAANVVYQMKRAKSVRKKGTESCHDGELSSDITKTHERSFKCETSHIGCYINLKLWTMNTAWNICNIKYMQTMCR